MSARSAWKCRPILSPVLLTLCLSAFARFASSQACSPPAITPSHALNLFNEQQEYDLGEVFAQQISYSLHVIEDPDVAGYLQRIGDRLVANMPATKLRFRFFLIDSPSANAFAIPGGRVYVTRKLITTVHSEDELAGVIGHEMGHQLAHHGALDWSRIFHDLLGVTSVGDRADIEDKVNEVLDTSRTKPRVQVDADREQLGADQVAIYAVARAGYSPQAVIDFWDRFTESQGKKGNWWSDYFGNTRPESKRLREFVNDLKRLPAGCIQTANTGDPLAFARWQAAVKTYNGFGKKESLPTVDVKRTLDLPLRGDIRQFRFSPDGRFVLALDEGSIFVLTREPLANLFRIDAPDAMQAQFSADSRYVVFYSAGFRIERWNIAEQRLEDVREPYIFGGCLQSAVSPDGDYLACIRPDRDTFFPLYFQLYDTSTGAAVLTKKRLIGALSPGQDPVQAFLLLRWVLGSALKRVVAMNFSPDGRYLILGRPPLQGEAVSEMSQQDGLLSLDVHLMVDMKSLSEVSMPAPLRKITSYTFAFVGPDRVVGADDERLEHSSLVKVPSGETLLSDIPTGGRTLAPVTRGLYAIVRPMPKAPLGILDLESKEIFRASHTDATDVFDDVLVSERSNGEVALYRVREAKPFAAVNLPPAPLASLAAVAVAPDASAIAISQISRGAVWNLATGQRSIYVRGFRGAFFGKDGLYLDFAPQNQFREIPVQGETEKDVRKRESEMPGDAIVRADPGTQSMTEILTVRKRTQVHQFGQVVLSWSAADDDKPNKDITLEARDAHSGKLIWSRFYAKGLPRIDANDPFDVAVFFWDLGTPQAKEALQGDADAKEMVHSLREGEGSYLVEVVDLHSGASLAKFPIDTGRASFRASHFLAAAGIVAMIDSHNRTLLYSFKGERKGRFFGGEAALSPDGHRICLEQEPGRLALYDIDSPRELDQMTFPERVVYAGFSADNRHLVVMTDDQTVYVFANLWPHSNSPSN